LTSFNVILTLRLQQGKCMSNQVKTYGNDKLTTHNVVHLVLDGVVTTNSVGEWIKRNPLALYKAVMGYTNNCVIIPFNKSYRPSLHHTQFKLLEQRVKLLEPKLVFASLCRKVKKTGEYIPPAKRKFLVRADNN
jgi:hypothetical protein